MAMAKAKVSRVQPWACVMGCNHSPKPWRMPIDRVRMQAPHSKTWLVESILGELFIIRS